MNADSDSHQAPARKVRPRKGGLWPWLHRLGTPATFFAASQRWLPWLWALAIIALVILGEIVSAFLRRRIL